MPRRLRSIRRTNLSVDTVVTVPLKRSIMVPLILAPESSSSPELSASSTLGRQLVRNIPWGRVLKATMADRKLLPCVALMRRRTRNRRL